MWNAISAGVAVFPFAAVLAYAFVSPGKSGLHMMVSLTERERELLMQYTEDNMDAENMWKTFVESISIKERENRKLQRNNIPLHFRTYMPEFSEEGEKGTAQCIIE